MTTEAARRAVELGEELEKLQGRRVEISEMLTWSPHLGFDRHHTTTSQVCFGVSLVRWQMSGGHFTLDGDDKTFVQIGTARLTEVEVTPEGLSITERFGADAVRRWNIRVLA